MPREYTEKRWKEMQDEAAKVLEWPLKQQAAVYQLLYAAGMRISDATRLLSEERG